MNQPESFLLERDPETGVAVVTLNRPDRLNALTFQVYDELRNTFYALSDDPSVRVVVITGSGRGFCSGGDVEDIIGALFERDFRGLLEVTDDHAEALSEIDRLYYQQKNWRAFVLICSAI